MQEPLPYQSPFVRSIGPYHLQRVVLINGKPLCWLAIKFINKINNPFLYIYTSGHLLGIENIKILYEIKNGHTIKSANDVWKVCSWGNSTKRCGSGVTFHMSYEGNQQSTIQHTFSTRISTRI